MAFEIVIGSGAQPAGFDIVIGAGGGGGGGGGTSSLIQFTVPDAPIGATLLVLIVRAGVEPIVPPAGWDLILEGVGGGGVFLDAFARMVDATDIPSPGELPRVVSFGCLATRELQGQIFAFENAAPATIIEAYEDATFSADATPPVVAPSPGAQDRKSVV